MNEPISWDPTLIKKFSSSNHYKLLNQLRNEVKKYPLNNKKKISAPKKDDTHIDYINKTNLLNTKDNKFINNSNQCKETISNKSTVSFNNSRNFSIYNQTTNNNNSQPSSFESQVQSESEENSSSITFKDRLNQIDMK